MKKSLVIGGLIILLLLAWQGYNFFFQKYPWIRTSVSLERTWISSGDYAIASRYKGESNISGVYSIGYAGDVKQKGSLEHVCFDPDEKSKIKLPQDYLATFCFENTTEAKSLLNIVIPEKENEVCDYRGKATIVINGWKDIFANEPATKLQKVISRSEPEVIPNTCRQTK